MIGSKAGTWVGNKGGNTTDDGKTIHSGVIAASRAGGGYYRDMDGYLQWADAAPGYKKPTPSTPTPTTTPTTTPTSYSPNNYTEPAPTTPTPQVAPTQQPTYYTPPSGPKGVGQTGVTGGTTPQTQTVRPDRPSQNQGWTTANTHTGTEVYYDPNENRWEFGRGTPVGKAGLAHILAQQPAQQNTYTPPATQQQQPAQAVVPQAEATPAMPTWDQVYGDALDIQGRKAQTEDPTQDPRVMAGTHYLGWNNAVLPYAQTVQSADWGGIVSGNEAYDSLTPKEKVEANKRFGALTGVRGVNRAFDKHNADSAAKSVDMLNAWKQYEDVIDQPWGTPRRDDVIDLWRDGKITYDEYRAGAHNVSPNQDGVYDSIDNQSFDGRYGSGGFSASGLPVPESPYARPQQQYSGPPLGSGQQMQAAQYRAAPQQQTQMPQQSMAQQYGWGDMGGGGAPQGMAGMYGWGAGLGGQQQQMMPQWGQQPPQQQQMPQWGGQPQQGMGGMPQWGGAPQQQAMPQWGQMMQQQPMGGPMAGMEAARMGGGAMQQMGGGSPWASMWGDPFAGRQMTTDPNSPAMGGLPQMDPTQQLMMQMMGGGGGLSGGFGAGGGSSGGGGMSGGGQTGAAQTGGGMDYDGLASILALFAGGGYGGGGGVGGGYNPMYGGLPRNGLFYADLMGAGG